MLNDCKLLGRISTDLELKKTNQGKDCITFDIAVRRDKGDKADFITVKAYNVVATNLVKFKSIGDRIIVCGQLHINTYTNKNQQKQKEVFVMAEKIYYLDNNVDENNYAANIDVPTEVKKL
ncbi:MAG: single-stranded DNA-binding protein [Ruminococcus sp.]|nr:single-stranded DNA-binding protein [Ruminococcus sp.]